MIPKSHPKTSGIERAMVTIALLFTAALFAYAISSLPGILDLRPSLFALIPAVGIVSNLVLLFVINARRARIGNVLWFGLFLGSIVYWGISELMLELSASAAAAIFWRPLTGIASAFSVLLILLFVAGQTRPKLLERKLVPWISLFGAGVTFLYFLLDTNLFVDHDPAHILHLGYGLDMAFSETGGLLFLIWTVSMSTLVTILLVKHYRRQTDPLLRKQARLFIAGTLIFSIGVIITDVLIPSVLGNVAMPPLGQLEATIMAVLFGYGLLRYNLFVIDPATVAPNILQTMAEAVIVTDTGYHILFSNVQAGRLLGEAEHSAIGAQLPAVFSVSDWTGLRQRVEQGIAHGGTINLEDVAVVAGGRSAVSVDISISQVVDDNNQIAGIVWVLNDVSNLKEANKQLAKEKASVERKVIERTQELSETQARLAASLSGLPFGFAIVTADGQIVFHNTILASLLRRKIPEGAASAKVLKAIAADYQSSIDILGSIRDSQATGTLVQKDISFGPMYYHFLFVPVIETISGQPTPVGTVMIMEDTTEKRAMDRSRDEFFSIASHELRTPLTAIRGNAEMILDYYPEPLKDPALKEMVSDMRDGSVRLISVVNDFLDTSRLEQGKIQFKTEAFDIVQLVRDILRQYDVTGSRRKLSLELADPPKDTPQVFADRDRTRQIIINLLSNAIKFTEKGGVTIALVPGQQIMKIVFTDTGKGIAVASQHLLFHKFQQAAESILTRDNTHGTGLGLYISRMLAEGMSGKLNLAKSQAGKGSTFELELPLVGKAAGAKTPVKAPGNPAAK